MAQIRISHSGASRQDSDAGAPPRPAISFKRLCASSSTCISSSVCVHPRPAISPHVSSVARVTVLVIRWHPPYCCDNQLRCLHYEALDLIQCLAYCRYECLLPLSKLLHDAARNAQQEGNRLDQLIPHHCLGSPLTSIG